MIKFHCKNCGRKISIQDKYSGKHGKCPKCGNLIVVPDKSTIVEFLCENCGHKMSFPKTLAGKKGKCPKCKNIIVIPKIQTTSTLIEQSNTVDAKTNSKSSPYVLTLLDVPEKDKIQDQPISQPSVSEKPTDYGQELEEESPEETESVAQRKLPWFIDVFLYPISTPCLITLGIIILIPLLINIAAGLLGPFGFFILIPGFFIRIVIGLYFLWYLAECIRDSADGGIRAPETMGNAPSLGDMLWQTLKIASCWLLFVGPPGFYFVYTNRADAIYWSLLAYAVFFLPMGLLSVVMFDSLCGLNPLLLIGSIFSTFFPYCGLVLIPGAVVLIVKAAPKTQSGSLVTFVSGYLAMYILLVVAHLLGRFYWRYQEKLNWEV